jgi:hypothetical protein
MQENMLKFVGDFVKEDQIVIPRHIQKKMKKFKGTRVKIFIEIPREKIKSNGNYSFNRTRKLLRNVKENLSSEIIKDRNERI